MLVDYVIECLRILRSVCRVVAGLFGVGEELCRGWERGLRLGVRRTTWAGRSGKVKRMGRVNAYERDGGNSFRKVKGAVGRGLRHVGDGR